MALLKEKGRNSHPVVSRISKDLAYRINAMAEKEGVTLSGFLRLFIEECYPEWEARHKEKSTRKKEDMLQSALERKARVEQLARIDEKETGNAGEQPARGSLSDRSVDPVTSDGNRVSSLRWIDRMIADYNNANPAPKLNTLGV